MTGVGGEDFIEPRGLSSLFLGGEDFDDITMLEFSGEAAHLAVNFDAHDMIANFRVETIGEIEGERAFWQVNNVSFGSVDKNFIGKEI